MGTNIYVIIKSVLKRLHFKYNNVTLSTNTASKEHRINNNIKITTYEFQKNNLFSYRIHTNTNVM